MDFFEDEDLKKILGCGRGRFVGRIESFAELPQRIRAVRNSIPLLWAGGLENHSDVLREIGRHRPVIGPAPDCIDPLRDPWKMQGWLANAKIGVPRLATEPTADSDCHWLRKSVASSGGLGIDVHRVGGTITQSPESRGMYLQEYIDGVPMSATLCADDSGVHLFGMSLQLIGWPSLGASGFLFCGNAGPVDPGEPVTQQVLEAASILANQSGLRGVFGIDFVLRQGRAWFLEVNPRVTASHMLFELQQPGLIIHRHLAALRWKPVRARRSLEKEVSCLQVALSPVAARLILWTREDLRVPEGFGDDSCSTVRITDRPQPGTVVSRGSPFCSIQLTANDCDDLIRQLNRLEDISCTNSNPSLVMLRTLGYATHTIAGQLELLWRKHTCSTMALPIEHVPLALPGNRSA
ncbi:MAG: ATP-grasp domain-containing protein [Fuerstia sp.]|nr:ATP-grasp domain-containing protein [Fuerstiella sp.]